MTCQASTLPVPRTRADLILAIQDLRERAEQLRLSVDDVLGAGDDEAYDVYSQIEKAEFHLRDATPRLHG